MKIKIIYKDNRTIKEKIQVIAEKYFWIPATKTNIECMNMEIRALEIEEANRKYNKGEISRKEWERIR